MTLKFNHDNSFFIFFIFTKMNYRICSLCYLPEELLKTIKKFLFTFILTYTSTTASAGFVDDTAKGNDITSVDEVLTMADNSYVTLEGYITAKIPKTANKYLFTDKKSKENLCVEIDEFEDGKRVMPEKPFGKNQKIRIRGEVDKDFIGIDKCDKFKIDVKEVELL